MGSEIDFAFPGSPYLIQEEFMKQAYSAISAGGICVLESPTGTGKSLSIICSSLGWLRDNRANILAQRLLRLNDAFSESVPTWVRRQAELNATTDALDIITQWGVYKSEMRSRSGRLGLDKSVFCEGAKRKAPCSTNNPDYVDTSDDFILTDTIDSREKYVGESPDIRDTAARVKVIIASRTHSQISQLMKELKRTSYKDQFIVITLGSRAQLCVNPNVPRDASNNQVNDFCRNLVEDGKCKFKKTIAPLQQLIVSTPMDLEDMFAAGAAPATCGCPYYASRQLESVADVILIPYSSLVNKVTRSALGIELEGNVVVIDEAHSILDFANSSRSFSLPMKDIESVLVGIQEYLQKFTARLSPKNLVSVKQLQFLCKRLHMCSKDLTGILVPVDAFVSISRLADIDIAAVLILLDNIQFARKLSGFMRNIRERVSSTMAIYSILSFVLAIHTSGESDRIFSKFENEAPKSIEFVAIDAESELSSIAKRTKALLLVSGTMKPVNEYEAVAALAGCPFHEFSGKYKVEGTRLLSRIIGKGLNGTDLLFNAHNKSQPDHIAAVGNVLELCISANPKGGIVIFVSSYAYCSDLAPSLAAICTKNKVGFYVDSASGKAANVLKEFTSAVSKYGCAVMISVVNGSLSEGIDFKDKLCRCVIMVGLPYPNPTDPVMKERMSYFDRKHLLYPQFPTGQAYFENKCIKSVNQAIGRSIRHSTDWSAIILLDSRFRRTNVMEGVSEWVRSETKVSESFSELGNELRQFFHSNSLID